MLSPASSLPVSFVAAMKIGVSSATHSYFHNTLPPVKPKAMNHKKLASHTPAELFTTQKSFAFSGSQCREKETNSLYMAFLALVYPFRFTFQNTDSLRDP